MENLPDYDNWKADDSMGAGAQCAQCDYCGEQFLLEELQEHHQVYVCKICLSDLEFDEQEFEELL